MDTSGQLRAAASREGSTFEAQRLRRALEQRLFRAGMPTRLGRYELERLVGRGGMGSVYAAWDPQLERRVAIKLLAGPSNEDARARLQREAMALAFLSHPHVVAVYEVVAVAEEAFVVMELVDGEPLSRWLARHAHFDRARAREVMELLLQAGRGLAAAHRAGLVHRDVKPSNILVGSDGRVRVADFGLVRLSTPQTPGDDVGASTNDLVGTPAYMSPEQIDGEVVDARSDQFSFCVTAFEAITGELPFAGATVSARREAMRRSSHPRARGVVSRRVHDILARGLAERSVDRFADMGELVRR
ncbi:MAG TPA: serine/threonine-protein kinase, partial [Nannocystaceae bacterium]|nr:serine/threonine-protein kinase [Nannocystaceae bacterium]